MTLQVERRRTHQPPHATVRVAVNDQGTGVPDEHKTRVFERFYQVKDPQAGSPSRSFGLGLTICQRIVNAHGGRIWVEDAPGGGAAFVFELPAGDAVPDPIPPCPTRTDADEAGSTHRYGRRAGRGFRGLRSRSPPSSTPRSIPSSRRTTPPPSPTTRCRCGVSHRSMRTRSSSCGSPSLALSMATWVMTRTARASSSRSSPDRRPSARRPPRCCAFSTRSRRPSNDSPSSSLRPHARLRPELDLVELVMTYLEETAELRGTIAAREQSIQELKRRLRIRRSRGGAPLPRARRAQVDRPLPPRLTRRSLS